MVEFDVAEDDVGSFAFVWAAFCNAEESVRLVNPFDLV